MILIIHFIYNAVLQVLKDALHDANNVDIAIKTYVYITRSAPYTLMFSFSFFLQMQITAGLKW